MAKFVTKSECDKEEKTSDKMRGMLGKVSWIKEERERPRQLMAPWTTRFSWPISCCELLLQKFKWWRSVSGFTCCATFTAVISTWPVMFPLCDRCHFQPLTRNCSQQQQWLTMGCGRTITWNNESAGAPTSSVTGQRSELVVNRAEKYTTEKLENGKKRQRFQHNKQIPDTPTLQIQYQWLLDRYIWGRQVFYCSRYDWLLVVFICVSWKCDRSRFNFTTQTSS